MTAYPSRPKFWAMRVIRALQVSGAVNDIGRDAAWLVTVVATCEDQRQYKKPARFWNSTLMSRAGFGHKGTFLKARAAALKAGWLHYSGGSRSDAGVYWTDIPTTVATATERQEDTDSGPNPDQNEESTRSESGPTTGPLSGPPIPRLYPLVAECASHPSAAATKRKRKTPEIPSEQFEQFWKAYPSSRRRNKQKTAVAFRAALQRVQQSQDGISSVQAAEWLVTRAVAFAASHEGQAFSPEPERWLRNERYDDADESWRQFRKSETGAVPDADQKWQAVKAAVRGVDKSQRYRESLQQRLDRDAFEAADRVGFRNLFGLDQYNEKHHRATFFSALAEVTTTVCGGVE